MSLRVLIDDEGVVEVDCLDSEGVVVARLDIEESGDSVNKVVHVTVDQAGAPAGEVRFRFDDHGVGRV